MSDWGLATTQQADNQIITSWGRASIGELLHVCNPSSTASSSTAWGTVNLARFIPFTVGRPFVAKAMTISVGSTSNGTIDLGIYDDQGNQLVHKGSTTMGTASTAQQLTLTNTLLEPGLYYMAMSCSSSTGTLLCTPLANVSCCSALGQLQMATAHPLPATATFAANTGTFTPYLMVSGRTLL